MLGHFITLVITIPKENDEYNEGEDNDKEKGDNNRHHDDGGFLGLRGQAFNSDLEKSQLADGRLGINVINLKLLTIWNNCDTNPVETLMSEMLLTQVDAADADVVWRTGTWTREAAHCCTSSDMCVFSSVFCNVGSCPASIHGHRKWEGNFNLTKNFQILKIFSWM